MKLDWTQKQVIVREALGCRQEKTVLQPIVPEEYDYAVTYTTWLDIGVGITDGGPLSRLHGFEESPPSSILLRMVYEGGPFPEPDGSVIEIHVNDGSGMGVAHEKVLLGCFLRDLDRVREVLMSRLDAIKARRVKRSKDG